MAKRLRVKEPAEECRYEVGQRVIFTPARGPSRFCRVSSVDDVDGRCRVGLKADGEKTFQGIPGSVASSSGSLKQVLLPPDKAVVRRLLQGLEAKSEKDALRFSSKHRHALQSLSPSPTPPGRRSLRSQSLERNESSPWVKVLEHLEEGKFSGADAHHVFQRCCDGEDPLPCSLLLALAQRAQELVRREPMVLHLAVPSGGRLVLLGDTHGHLKDVVHIWKIEGTPSRDLVYIFNGDICDRGDSDRRGGQRALQIWACVLAFKIAMPKCIYVTRGNHEDRDYWPQYGAQSFSGEIESKYTERCEVDDLLDVFGDLCDLLPLAAVVDETCLVMHGGLPRCWDQGGKLEELHALERPLRIPENVDGRQKQLIYDATWADPQHAEGLGPNDRGGEAVSFGPDITSSVLQSLKLRLFLRSHELPGRSSEEFKGRGYEWWHKSESFEYLPGAAGMLLSVFTASDYCGVLEGNCGARVVWKHGCSGFEIVEHQGWEAEQSWQKLSFDPAEGLLSEGPLERSVIEAVVERKHELLTEFISSDFQKDWLLPAEAWESCCRKVVPEIPWQDLLGKPSIVPMQSGQVNYMLFLTRYQVRFHHKEGLHASFHRRMAAQLFAGILGADRTLRGTLEMLDPDGDGRVSSSEFTAALRRAAPGLLPSQALALYRTAAEQGGNIRVEDLLGTLSLHFALTEPRATTAETDFVPQLLDAICRDILGFSSSPAVRLRHFFEEADVNKNGYLEPKELAAALRGLPSTQLLEEEQLSQLTQYVDLNGDGRINYMELLRALYVRAGHGARALLEDSLEAVHRVLHFEFARPLRSLLRSLGFGRRCSRADFRRALVSLNTSSTGAAAMSDEQLSCLVESIDVETAPGEEEPHLDFEDFLDSFAIVDSFEDPDVLPEDEEDLLKKILEEV